MKACIMISKFRKDTVLAHCRDTLVVDRKLDREKNVIIPRKWTLTKKI